jgi:hypothetical protein
VPPPVPPADPDPPPPAPAPPDDVPPAPPPEAEPPEDPEPPLEPPLEPDDSSVEVVSVLPLESLADVSGTDGGSVVTGALELLPLFESPPEKSAATTITNSSTQPIATSRRRQ